MKKFILIAAAMALSGCKLTMPPLPPAPPAPPPPPQTVVADWRAFVRTPNEDSFKTVYADVKACPRPDCPAAQAIDETDIENLIQAIYDGKPFAIRFGMAATHLLSYNAAGSENLSAALGEAALVDPKAFLDGARLENFNVAGVIDREPSSLADDFTDQAADFELRRSALLTVQDPALAQVRATAVAVLDKTLSENRDVGGPGDTGIQMPSQLPDRLFRVARPIAAIGPKAFTVGVFKGHFEGEGFDAAEKVLGSINSQTEGDAAASLDWLCYTLPGAKRVWLTSDEMGGSGRYIMGVEMMALPAGASGATACPALNTTTAEVDGVSLGMDGSSVSAHLGAPSSRRGDWWVYGYANNRTVGSIALHFKAGRVDRLIANRLTAD